MSTLNCNIDNFSHSEFFSGAGRKENKKYAELHVKIGGYRTSRSTNNYSMS